MTQGIPQTLEDQFRAMLQGRQYGGYLNTDAGGTSTVTGGMSYNELNPYAQQQLMIPMSGQATEFQLFGGGSPFSDFLSKQAGSGYDAARTSGDWSTRLQNLRTLLRAEQGGLGGFAPGADATVAQKEAAAELGTRLRGSFGGEDRASARMRAGLSQAMGNVNPYFQGALQRGAEQGFASYRGQNPGTSFLDYASAIGLF